MNTCPPSDLLSLVYGLGCTLLASWAFVVFLISRIHDIQIAVRTANESGAWGESKKAPAKSTDDVSPYGYGEYPSSEER